ncbi:imelysin family protein [uncultured Roseibium sp.]|uniref:imelysin family protein n=1 Tax=uncultured Roseibium sp. TaxID=1936171 RepID=UPI00260FE814|nr:imelysin family protein [uncultured Roseibium sp.]
MRKLVLGIAALVAIVPPAFAADFNDALDGVITGFIRPATTEFAEISARLPSAVSTVCKETNEANLRAFENAYSETIESFSRIQFLRFGPLLEDDRLSRLAFLPDPRGTAQRQIRKIYAAKDDSVLSAETLRDKSVAVQSLTAFDLIAFDKDTNIVLGADGENRAFTCGYALAIAQNVAAISQSVASEWRDPEGYSRLLLSGGGENARFRTSQEALESVFNALTTGVTIAKDQDILPALGTSADKAKPRRFPFSRSANSVVYLSGELGGLRDALTSMNLKRLMPSEDQWTLDTIGFEFKNAGTYLSALTVPLRNTFAEDGNYNRVAALSIVLSSIQELMSEGVAGSLGLAGGFNALDGD